MNTLQKLKDNMVKKLLIVSQGDMKSKEFSCVRIEMDQHDDHELYAVIAKDLGFENVHVRNKDGGELPRHIDEIQKAEIIASQIFAKLEEIQGQTVLFRRKQG